MSEIENPPPDDPKTPPGGGQGRDGASITIEEEMRRSYLDYAMSVIVARALPDVRDGLKPVHRRILYTMYENGFTPGKPYKKSARVVGDVMGKYHPHGDLAVYDAMVRLAQHFSMRLPLIDGQGNFGSMDGDNPAAQRYTEARLEKAAMALLDDLENDTVDYTMNYSNEFKEPVVLPARYPNLLVNGSAGIAVGMATNIPPHNLGEVIDACLAYINDPDVTPDQLAEIVPGPDFPTGALIIGKNAARAALQRGRGSIIVRAKTHIETIRKDREAIIVTEFPYQVNKGQLIEKIGELVKEKKIEGISEVRDESDRQGVRSVIELKRDAVADVVLNQLFRFTQLQISFGVNMLALNRGRPELLGLKDVITAFVDFREEVVARRMRFLLRQARDKAHIQVGLAIAVANIDEFIHIIRTSPDPATARARIMERAWPAKDMAPLVALIADPRHVIGGDGMIRLSEEQARAILELRLHRLTGLGRDELGGELTKLGGEIKDYLEILGSRSKLMGIIRDELTAMKAEFATPRRTQLVEMEGEVEDEDLIQREDMVVTVTHAGAIKRVPLSAYRVQARGGRGRTGVTTREEDFVTRLFVASTHAPILFFSSAGMAYVLKVWRLPLSTPQGRGKALVNLLPLKEGETITTVLPLPEKDSDWEGMDVMFATRSGDVRRNSLADFTSVKANGKIAMKIEDGDAIIAVQLCSARDDVLLTTRGGKCIRFSVEDVRVFKGRDSTGVRGIKLNDGEQVVSAAILRHVDATPAEARAYLKQAAQMRRAAGDEDADTAPVDDAEDAVEELALTPERYAELGANEQFVLTLSARGFGKRTSAYEYRVTGRGGSGIVAMAMSDRNGVIVASFPVEDSDQIMLISDGGQTIRCPVGDVRIAGRATQGVTVFRLSDGESVVSVERIGDAEGLEGEAPDAAG
ncbi:MAG TPA: DNA gyrase subunit A [Alphaproteobacteria bacterium]|nr:DNA gyrase subunit A [Alphaproteobacteria bacterium]HAJ47550.1 DNA gyrase subunit A [Alphaproteobacteria bacterium]